MGLEDPGLMLGFETEGEGKVESLFTVSILFVKTTAVHRTRQHKVCRWRYQGGG